MKKLEGKLPLIAFAFAAFAAFAFTSPETEQWGKVDEDTYINVTDIPPSSTTYTCDSAQNAHCLYDDDGGEPLSPGENKMFVNRGVAPLK
ncbi:DUF6520 family protein [Algoriphagus resistens]|uniref:DUF6520 family protein n=1 Tax=Algoriphagus resistens TaxID=1750590 RepID=UPI0007168032|nr:DUF6520 family protein [Algoriphagus resistens]